MLRLTRKAGEQVLVGGEVVVKVLEVMGGRVRLGIAAPPGCAVRRGEDAAREPARPGLRPAALEAAR
jgi:carbon storage regulator